MCIYNTHLKKKPHYFKHHKRVCLNIIKGMLILFWVPKKSQCRPSPLPEQVTTAPLRHEDGISGRTEMRNGPELPQPSGYMFTWNCSLGARRLVCGGGLYLGRLGWRQNTEMSQSLSLSLSEHSSPRGRSGRKQVGLVQNEEDGEQSYH